MQTGHEVAHWPVQVQVARLAQLEYAGGGEGLGVRCHPEPVARRERYATRQVRVTKGQVEYQFSLVRDGDCSARLFGQAHLELYPARQVVQRSGEPFFQTCLPCESARRLRRRH